MIRALYHLRSGLSAFTGGRFIVEGKIACFQRGLDYRRMDLQSTAVINGKPRTVYIPCRFKKSADMNRILKKSAEVKIAENGVAQTYLPTATVLVWGDFTVTENGGKVRLETTVFNSKQLFVLPFDLCPDRSKC